MTKQSVTHAWNVAAVAVAAVAVLLLRTSTTDASFLVHSPPLRNSVSWDMGVNTHGGTAADVTVPATTCLQAGRSSHRDRSSQQQEGEQEISFLLRDFVMYNGEVLDPYSVLKISRRADTPTVKEAYRRLSRLYHPDARRYRDILPGSCNNEVEVRDQWERINMSYRILSDPVQRRKYDRHEALADPGQALRRAAAQAAWSGVVTAGKGLWTVGSHAIMTLVQHAENVATITTTKNTAAATTTYVDKQETATVVEYKSHKGWQASKTGAFHPEAEEDDDDDDDDDCNNDNNNEMKRDSYAVN